MKIKIVLFLVSMLANPLGHAQGFLNLNFEQGLTASNTIPGWIAYVNNSPTEVISNDIALNGGAVCLLGTNFGIIQGNYYVYIQGQSQGFPNSASLGQTGIIPLTAQSLIFWGNVNANDVSFNGNVLPLVVLGTTANYNIYGANVSGFAGDTGQLLFTSLSSQMGGQWDSVDNIQFSSSPVPEPSAVGLSALGSALLAWRRWRKCAQA